MPFTKEEKVKIRHHLGYLNVASASTFVLGSPAAVETSFIIEGAMDRVLVEAEGEVRRHLQILNSIEEQMIGDHELLAVTQVDEISVNPKEHQQLRDQYDYWRQGLSNLLGVYTNPFDKRPIKRSLNAKVSHLSVWVCPCLSFSLYYPCNRMWLFAAIGL